MTIIRIALAGKFTRPPKGAASLETINAEFVQVHIWKAGPGKWIATGRGLFRRQGGRLEYTATTGTRRAARQQATYWLVTWGMLGQALKDLRKINRAHAATWRHEHSSPPEG